MKILCDRGLSIDGVRTLIRKNDGSYSVDKSGL